jgi:hypothetical protein
MYYFLYSSDSGISFCVTRMLVFARRNALHPFLIQARRQLLEQPGFCSLTDQTYQIRNRHRKPGLNDHLIRICVQFLTIRCVAILTRVSPEPVKYLSKKFQL